MFSSRSSSQAVRPAPLVCNGELTIGHLRQAHEACRPPPADRVTEVAATVLRVDLPFWVTIVTGLVTVAVAGGIGHWTGVRSATIAARESQADRELERERLTHERLMRQDARLDQAWELCQSPNGADWQAGIALLHALLAEPDLAPQVKRYADSLVAIMFTGDLGERRRQALLSGQAPDVDIYVDVNDDGSEEVEHDGE